MSAVTIDVAEIDAEIQEAERRLTELRTVRNYIASRIPATNGGRPAEAASESRPEEPGGRQTYAGMTAADAAEACLRNVGRPMRAPEIAKEILANGFETQSGDPSNALFTVMSRHPTVFAKVGPGVWALTAWHLKANTETEE